MRQASAAQVKQPGSRLRAYSQFVAQQAAHDQFSGTVLLAYRGRPELARSFGMADQERSIANRPTTMFGLASLGKIFTGIAAGQLAAQGTIDFCATVGRYLDGFPAEIAGSVTVHQTFTHTSGMGNYMSSPVWQQEARSWTTPAQEFADTMAIIQQSPLLFTPGTAYSYSNSGYYTLGAIVAQVSGQPLGDYLQTHIFGPAGMTHTGNYTTAQILANPGHRARLRAAAARRQPRRPDHDAGRPVRLDRRRQRGRRRLLVSARPAQPRSGPAQRHAARPCLGSAHHHR